MKRWLPGADKTPANAVRVIVSWRDIRDASNWDEDGEVRCSRNLQTIGWLLYDGPDPNEPDYDIVVIAKTYDYEEERWSDYTIFPKTVIKGMK